MNFNPAKKISTQSGQALLLVLLSMSVVLIVVLSVVSSSVSDISLTGRSENSQRAFSAAEAGIEKALVGGGVVSSDLGNGSGFTASITDISRGQNYHNFPQDLISGESTTLWFVSHDTGGNLTCSGGLPCYSSSSSSAGLKMCWSGDDNILPAIEVSIYYDTNLKGISQGDYSGLKVARAAFDPYSSRTADNMFTLANTSTCTLGTKTYSFNKSFTFDDLGINTPKACVKNAGCLLAAKVRILYNSSSQMVGAELVDGTFPGQGKIVESVGTAGDTSRKVQVYQTYGELPSVFDAAVFSTGNIQKESLN